MFDLDNPFWRFSLAVYSAEGVTDECIALQDTIHINVNTLLFAAWLGAERSVVLTAEDFALIETRTAEWSQSVVQPLRQVRGFLKRFRGQDGELRVRRLSGLCGQIELEAEQVEQAMLFALAGNHWAGASRRSGSVTKAQANIEVLMHLHGAGAGTSGITGAALNHLSQAIAALSSTEMPAMTTHPQEKAAEPKAKRLVAGISGASGAIYGVRLLHLLRGSGVETHLIISKAAHLTIAQETGLKVQEVQALADRTYGIGDIGAACASGSFITMGMVIAPCSIKTMSEIATGATSNLLTRSADVALKERRRLILMLRETPLHLGHIRAMAAVTELGAILYPPVPAFYAKPRSLQEMVDHTLARVLDLLGLESSAAHRWAGLKAELPLTQE